MLINMEEKDNCELHWHSLIKITVKLFLLTYSITCQALS